MSKDFQEKITSITDYLLESILLRSQWEKLETDLLEFREYLNRINSSEILTAVEFNDEQRLVEMKKQMLGFDSGNADILNLIDLLTSNNEYLRFCTARNLEYIINHLKSELKKFSSANLILAQDFKNSDLTEICEMINQRLDKRYLFSTQIKSNIIAGFILEADAKIIDASVASALEEYRQEWVKDIELNY